MVYPSHGFLGLTADALGGLLEGLEARNQNVGEKHQALPPRVILAEAAQDARCYKLAEGGSAVIDILTITQMRLLVEELSSVDKEAVY